MIASKTHRLRGRAGVGVGEMSAPNRGFLQKNRSGLIVTAFGGLLLAGCASTAPGGPAPTSGYAVTASRTQPAWSPAGLPTDDRGRVRAYNRPYQVKGQWYSPAFQPGYDQVGIASWYGYESGRTTFDGEAFLTDEQATAAHRTLPIPSLLEVTNLDNGRKIRVRLNDRGPFAPGRLIDLSRDAARRLGFLEKGTARVRVRYIGPAPLQPKLDTVQIARSTPYRPSPAPVVRVTVQPEAAPVKDSLDLVAGLP